MADAQNGAPSRDTLMADIPSNLSIWEAATYGRKVILDGAPDKYEPADALRKQAEKEAAAKAQAATKESIKHGITADQIYKPLTGEVVSDHQLTMERSKENARYMHLEKQILDLYRERMINGVPIGSSLPHLSQKAEGRAAHVTSSRVVGSVQRGGETYIVHERFHQDQGPRTNMPSHDRFFATNQSGGVLPVTPQFRSAGQGAPSQEEVHKLNALYQATVGNSRNDGPRPLLNSLVHDYVDWNVGDKVESKQPPLSPRSLRRTLPDTGYAMPSKHGK